MRITFVTFALVLACTPSCTQLVLSADVAYAQMAVDGNIALADPPGSPIVDQDFEQAFGLGDEQGTPYVRAQADFGVPVLTVSAFTFDESGTGTLSGAFGGIPAGANVNSKLDFTNVKGSLTFDIPLGPVTLAPGVAVSVFDLEFDVQEVNGLASENVQSVAPIPMAFLRAEADLGTFGAFAELGYIKVWEISDIEGTFWDAEVRAEVRPTPSFRIFAGYRMLHADADGIFDDQEFATDMDITGWMVGGGVRF